MSNDNKNKQNEFAEGVAGIAAIFAGIWCYADTNEIGTAIVVALIAGAIGYYIGKLIWLSIVLALLIGGFLLRQAACNTAKEVISTEVLKEIEENRFIYFKNSCNEEVKLALFYKDLNGEWIQKYWYDVSGYKSHYLMDSERKLITKNKSIYLYAYSQNYEWRGDYEYNINYKSFQFRLINMELDEDGDYVIDLQCGS